MKNLLCVIMIFCTLTVYGQDKTRTITGKVKTAETNEAIIGATVKVYCTPIETFTNVYGKYAINVPNGQNELIFQFIGYKPLRVPAGKSDTLNIKLEPIVVSLDYALIDGVRTIAITGTVTTADDGAPIYGVSVLSENNNNGVSTDRAGKFSLRIPYYFQRLIFKAAGYKTDTVKVKSDTTISVALHIEK